MRYSVLIALLLLQVNAFAQFRYEARVIRPADKDSAGYYQIPLSPGVTGRAREGLGDLRLFGNGKEIPFIIRTGKPGPDSLVYREYNIIEKEMVKKCCTRIVMHNPDRKMIDNISLKIGNAEVVKRGKLLGSSNGRDWYVVKEDFDIRNPHGRGGVSEIRAIGFPPTDYEFYKLELADSLNDPVNIQGAGYYERIVQHTHYTALPEPQLVISDSSGIQLLKLYFPHKVLLERFELVVESPRFFKRTMRVFTERTERRKKREVRIKVPVAGLELHSGYPLVWDIAPVRSDYFLIEIEQGNNPSLKIKDIKGFHQNSIMVANLGGEGTYYLRFGDPESVPPRYDLEYFRDSIPETLPVLELSEVTMLTENEKSEESIFKREHLWLTLLFVLAFMGFMTWRMIRDMKNK